MDDEAKPRDFWDSFHASAGALTFASALVVAAVGWWFADGCKKREQKLTESEVTTKMLPFLEEGGRETKAALFAMAPLDSTELATQFAT